MQKSGCWDFIIVGAGSSGCVMAERLSANGKASVLVLEAGGTNKSPLVSFPKGFAKLIMKPEHIWTYEINQPRRENEEWREIWLRGKGLGGSSSVNGMIWSRGEPSDYDDWEKMGCAGWNGETMTKAFRAIEDHEMGASELRGEGGNVNIAPRLFSYPLADKIIEAGQDFGLTSVDDMNGSAGPRVGLYSHNIKNGKRQSSAVTFLRPAQKRSNVKVVTGALAEKITFEGKKVSGINAVIDGVPTHFACNGEIIVCAGALESPLLLQRSGVGPAERLRWAGITPIVDSPDVGERMREHLAIIAAYRLNTDIGTNKNFYGFGFAKAMARYLVTRRGIMATGPFEVGAFTNIGDRTDLQLYFGGYTYAPNTDNRAAGIPAIDKVPGMTVYGQLLRLSSEGSIRVSGPSTKSKPAIEPNWLSTEEDRRAAIATMRYIRGYVAQDPLADLIEHEISPGSDCQSDEQLLEDFRTRATCGLHAVGTCRMGSDNRSVCDGKLRVNGVEGLRVVDCSVMPGPISGNTNAPAMALAHRAAELVLQDSR